VSGYDHGFEDRTVRHSGSFLPICSWVIFLQVKTGAARSEFRKRSPIAVSNYQFQKIIYTRCPVGTPEAEIVRELSAQGFRRSDDPGQMPIESSFQDDNEFAEWPEADGMMRLTGRGFGFVCTPFWVVQWQVDPNKTISTIHAWRASWCL
jgi:hypothetical protein